ncbi:MAG: glycosyltransferase family 2 protein [Burkholderiaceae bacterium]
MPAAPEPPAHRALILIPSFNSGRLLADTAISAREQWPDVWVVVDGSTDDSADQLSAACRPGADIRVLTLAQNQGKGAALLHGMQTALREGFTHVLTMDADGQHPAASIGPFIALSQAHPHAMILGRPVFGADAPALRTNGRKISNWWANLETLWAGIDDSLFGFRVYPIAPLVRIMQAQRWMRRFDFDVEAVVRLYWAGVSPVNQPAPVRYLRPEEGGVSHFNYLRDNLLLTWMHARLFVGFLVRLPVLIVRRMKA